MTDLERLTARVARVWAAQVAQARLDAKAARLRAERRRAAKVEEARQALVRLRPPADSDP